DELDAEGYHFMPGQIYPKVFNEVTEVSPEQAMDLLRQGYFAVQVANMPTDRHHQLPLVVFNQRPPIAASPSLGGVANFFLARNGNPVYGIINGYLIDLSVNEPPKSLKNYVF